MLVEAGLHFCCFCMDGVTYPRSFSDLSRLYLPRCTSLIMEHDLVGVVSTAVPLCEVLIELELVHTSLF